MKRMNCRVVPIILAAFVAASVQAADRYAAHSGQAQDPAHAYTSWSSAASNIQDAVNAAAINETVWVGPGTYTRPPNATNYGGWNVVYINKPLTLRSSNGVPATTIIDGAGTNRGIAAYYPVNTANRLTIDGLTVRHCWATNTGGGILLDSSNRTWTGEIRNCVISNNTVSWGYDFSFFGSTTRGFASRGGGIGVQMYNGGLRTIVSNCVVVTNRALNGTGSGTGGGIYFRTPAALPLITHSVLWGNRAGSGGAYQDAGGTPTIQNCVVRNNTALSAAGGGLYLASYGTVRNCLIYANKSPGAGAGINVQNGASPKLQNCTIVLNQGPGNGSGVMVNYINMAGTKLTMWNCIVVSNLPVASANEDMFYNFSSTPVTATNRITVSNTCVYCTNDLPGSGNFAADPKFANFAVHNYRLTAYSPCLNTGTEQTWMTGALDLDGLLRIREGVVDRGCYELYLIRGTSVMVR